MTDRLVKPSEMVEGRWYLSSGNKGMAYRYIGSNRVVTNCGNKYTVDSQGAVKWRECCEHGKALGVCRKCLPAYADAILERDHPPSLRERWRTEAAARDIYPDAAHHGPYVMALRRCADDLEQEQGAASFSVTEDVYRMLNELDEHNITGAEQLRDRLHIAQTHHDLQMRAEKAERELEEINNRSREFFSAERGPVPPPPQRGPVITCDHGWNGDDT